MFTLSSKIIDLHNDLSNYGLKISWVIFGDHCHQDDGNDENENADDDDNGGVEEEDDDENDDDEEEDEIWGLCPQQRWLAVVEELLLHTSPRPKNVAHRDVDDTDDYFRKFSGESSEMIQTKRCCFVTFLLQPLGFPKLPYI